ncbi:lysophospholipid acyltransferase family protein [Pseudoruegeria sp. SHC-113]|uniref:lysophospholipid acyltransferase family protein n=1 Tax=Pseudoruegeria sp. SHC-113 TaxID=2855439 RepID=UPI0021BB5E12|nr:lysophospholipid acyltransferase family protein [Pseudoruegeria sp. SHC-113]MCT8160810.1 lysophospholipid acyltransferase family protein [Pseudoruegeria sp. SHC-113]
MTSTSRVARDISYASSAATKGGRAVIRVLENATGRMGLIRRARGYELDVANGADFWQVMMGRYGLSLDVVQGSLQAIPREGPLILVSNHPYGILDGLMMGHILATTRGDFRIMANNVFQKAEDLNRFILPISFDATKEAMKLNLETRTEALRFLGQGGAIGIFPGGTVSTAATPFAKPMDPGWRNFTAKMVARSDATVVPIFFEGHNSRLFQIASHLHQTLRLGLLIKEFKKRTNAPVRISVGAPIDPQKLRELSRDPKAMMDFLRKATYELSPTPLKSLEYGFEFEDKYKVLGK